MYFLLKELLILHLIGPIKLRDAIGGYVLIFFPSHPTLQVSLYEKTNEPTLDWIYGGEKNKIAITFKISAWIMEILFCLINLLE